MDPKRIEQLRDPSVFPGAADTVDLIQTHLSVVCVVGDFAYKFKKAIELPFVDFSSLENRKRFCEEELRLNRRLCPSLAKQRRDAAKVWLDDGTAARLQ